MSITRRSRYYKNNYRTFALKLSVNKDRDIISHLEKIDNITAYIRSLILYDLHSKRERG